MDLKNNYIHGDKFRDLAHFIFDEKLRHFSKKILERNAIVLCHTHFAAELLSFLNISKFKYILITHNSDIGVDEKLYSIKPKNIIKWFAQNVLIEKENLIPLPIGMERPHISGKGGSGDIDIIIEQKKCNKKIRNLAYLNYSSGTNVAARSFIKEKFKNFQYITFVEQRIPFKNYINDIYNHKFVFSPPGNGIDCHRTWETIYCDTIPIIKKDYYTDHFKELPILITENYEEINQEYLEAKYNEITNKKNNGLLKIEKSMFYYWKRRILEDWKNIN